jgi:hypothetical protein
MSTEATTENYVNRGNPIVIVFINNLPFENTSIDLGGGYKNDYPKNVYPIQTMYSLSYPHNT